MSAPFDPSVSRRYVFPPLWAVPLVLMTAIVAVVLVALRLGWLAVIAAAVGIAWLERYVDRYVRERQRDL